MELIFSTIIAGVAGMFAGAVTGMIGARAMKRKNDADAASALSEAAKNLIEPLNRRIDDMNVEMRGLKKKLSLFLAGINRLIDQIKRLGQEPVWTPDMEAGCED